MQRRGTSSRDRKSCINYYAALYKAWPKWANYPEQYRAIYKEAQRLRRLGYKVHVDHTIPLRSDLVCGLHVPWNLQIISETKNYTKANKWWPDAPFEQPILELPEVEYHQLILI